MSLLGLALVFVGVSWDIGDTLRGEGGGDLVSNLVVGSGVGVMVASLVWSAA